MTDGPQSFPVTKYSPHPPNETREKIRIHSDTVVLAQCFADITCRNLDSYLVPSHIFPSIALSFPRWAEY